MTSLSDDNQADIIDAFNSTSRYLDNLLNFDNHYFEEIVNQIYPTELHLNTANTSDTETHLFGFTSTVLFRPKCMKKGMTCVSR